MMTVSPRDWNAHPPLKAPAYKSTLKRSPTQPLIAIDPDAADIAGPVFGHAQLNAQDADLTKNGRKSGEPIGERIVITGIVRDDLGRPLPDMLVEIWQTNSAGRYIHSLDQHDAPLDPNFLGAGRALTDAAGRYRFYTVKPGAYPWGNHPNAWRPAHIHFSLFGHSLASRLITQLYFPGDPLLPLDPIFMATPAGARERLIADFDLDITEPDFALGYRFDLVLRGRDATPMESGA